MVALPKLPRFASILAFVLAALIVLGAFFGTIILLPFAFVPLFAGIGIWRGRAWSAWGYAIWTLSQLLFVPLILYRAADRSATSSMIEGILSSLFLGTLYILAGRSLARTGAERGRALPWIALSVLMTVPWVFVEPFSIPTGAMEDTILVGDHIFVTRIPRGTPTRGDIFALVYPIDRKRTFIKRIIGVPGDRIRISHKVLYRNGVHQDEPYVVHKADYEDLYRDDFPSEPNTPLYPPAQRMLEQNVVNGELVVPAGKYFMLGDNRDQSLDSRYWGFVSDGDLIGKPLMIYDSVDQSTDQLTRPGATSPHHVRWNRLFRFF